MSEGWQGGIMVWEFPDAGSAWIEQVRGSAFPIGGGGETSTASASTQSSTTSTTSTNISTTSTTPTKTSTTASSSPTSGSQCAGIAAWSTTMAYTGGSKVTYK